jgi:hypothetical protein
MTTGSDISRLLKQFAEVRRSIPFKAAINQRTQFGSYTLENPEPMNLTKYQRDMTVRLSKINLASRTVEDSLQTILKGSWCDVVVIVDILVILHTVGN